MRGIEDCVEVEENDEAERNKEKREIRALHNGSNNRS